MLKLPIRVKIVRNKSKNVLLLKYANGVLYKKAGFDLNWVEVRMAKRNGKHCIVDVRSPMYKSVKISYDFLKDHFAQEWKQHDNTIYINGEKV